MAKAPASSNWQRARRPEQKQQRRAHILQAAALLFDELGFDGVSLSAIARQAGLAKSNVYRYFSSREEIFLALVADDYGDFVGALADDLTPLAGSDDAAAVAGRIAVAAARRPRLCALVSVLSSVIEQNITPDAFVAFKTGLVPVTRRIAELLHGALPSLPAGAAEEFQRYLQALAAGLWPMEQSTRCFHSSLERPEFEPFRADFERDLRRAIRAVLVGMASESPAP